MCSSSTCNDISEEIDFSKGVRGKFYKAYADLNLPVYLDSEVRTYLATIAPKKGHRNICIGERSFEARDRNY
jgi:hypothetical protein